VRLLGAVGVALGLLGVDDEELGVLIEEAGEEERGADGVGGLDAPDVAGLREEELVGDVLPDLVGVVGVEGLEEGRVDLGLLPVALVRLAFQHHALLDLLHQLNQVLH